MASQLASPGFYALFRSGRRRRTVYFRSDATDFRALEKLARSRLEASTYLRADNFDLERIWREDGNHVVYQRRESLNEWRHD
jgi:hypothetical protein